MSAFSAKASLLGWLLVAAVALGTAATSAMADSWPRFRGPNGEGKSDLKQVPTSWTESEYEWVVELPGKGHSSPVIWEDSLFLTSGTEDGRRAIFCFDATTGKERWSNDMSLSANHLHRKNSYASGTPATDGSRVYVVFADESHYTTLCYDMQGNLLWTRDLGTFTSQHGQGVSPILYNGLVIVPNDQMGPSSVIALDAESGETVWTSERQFRRTSYATPLVLDVEGKGKQLICLSGAVGLAGLDPATGKEIWHSGEMPMRTVGSPIYGNGMLVASCGSGGRGKYMVAVDPSGEGDVSSSHVRAERTQNLPYVPTPIVDGNYLYLWNDDGVVCCVDLTGDLTKNVWRERVGGNYSGSPVLIDGKLYCISEEGEIVVIAASPEFELLGRSPLGDQSYSTPAVANGRVYFRGFSRLACLKAESTP